MGYEIKLNQDQVERMMRQSQGQNQQYLLGMRDEVYMQRKENLLSNLYDRHPLNPELEAAVGLLRASLASLPPGEVVELLEEFSDRLGHLYVPVKEVQARGPAAVVTPFGDPGPLPFGAVMEVPPPMFGMPDDGQQEWELDPETHQYHPAGSPSSAAEAAELEEDDDEDDEVASAPDDQDQEWELDNETHQYHPVGATD